MMETPELRDQEPVKEEPRPSPESTDRELIKEELKRSVEEAKEDIAQTLNTIQKEVERKLDWREWVRMYPEESVLGALAVGYWLGQKFTSSSRANPETENQIVKVLGAALVTVLTNRATEILEDLFKDKRSPQG